MKKKLFLAAAGVGLLLLGIRLTKKSRTYDSQHKRSWGI